VRRFGLIVWRTFALFVLLVGLAFTLIAAVGWLQTAHWKPLTVGEALSSTPALREWIAHPRSWIGLHRIVSWIVRVPIFLLLTVMGIGLSVMSAPKEPKQIWQPWSGR
jgi:hypothetical protein